MSMIGYARVSSVGQSLEVQKQKLTNEGCDIIREEKVSGRKLENRPELKTLLEFIREGDTLVVCKIDRLARSVGDLSHIVQRLTEIGANLKVIDQPVDTSTPIGKCFLQMLGVFAEFENDIRAERQRDGIVRAKERGVYKGRKQSIDRGKVKELYIKGLGATKIAQELGCGRASVYRVIDEMRGRNI